MATHGTVKKGRIEAGKGDKPRPHNKQKWSKGYDLIDFSKTRRSIESNPK
jgi:hypothetical protein